MPGVERVRDIELMLIEMPRHDVEQSFEKWTDIGAKAEKIYKITEWLTAGFNRVGFKRREENNSFFFVVEGYEEDGTLFELDNLNTIEELTEILQELLAEEELQASIAKLQQPDGCVVLAVKAQEEEIPV